MARELKKGMVVEERTGCANGNPHSFLIQEINDGGELIKDKTYFAHLGDVFCNEQKLYGEYKGETLFLKKDQIVNFYVTTDTPFISVSSVKISN